MDQLQTQNRGYLKADISDSQKLGQTRINQTVDLIDADISQLAAKQRIEHAIRQRSFANKNLNIPNDFFFTPHTTAHNEEAVIDVGAIPDLFLRLSGKPVLLKKKWVHDPHRNLDTTRASSKWAEKSDGSIIEVGSNVPALTDKGLLVEPSATNYASPSVPDATYAGFSDPGLSTSPGQSSVFMDNSALHVNFGANYNYLAKFLPSFVAGKTYCCSAVVSADTLGSLEIRVCDGNSQYRACTMVDLSTGEVTGTEAVGAGVARTGGGAIYLGNGTYLIWVAGSLPVEAVNAGIMVTNKTNNFGAVKIHHMQFEDGETATSPIITTGSAATRSHDRVTMDISDLDLSQGVYGRWKGEFLDGGRTWVRLLDFYRDGGNRHSLAILRSDATGINIDCYNEGVGSAAHIGDWEAGQHEVVFGWGPSFMQCILDGSANTVASHINFPTGLEKLAIGTVYTGSDARTANTLHQELTLYAGTPTTEKLQALVTA